VPIAIAEVADHGGVNDTQEILRYHAANDGQCQRQYSAAAVAVYPQIYCCFLTITGLPA
jgi:hypothetical protein